MTVGINPQPIAIVADIHVTLTKNTRFEVERFEGLIDTLVEKSYPIIVIAGDLFHKARPSLEEIALVTKGIKKLCRTSTVYILAGNHEVVKQGFSTFDYLNFHIPKYCYVIKDGVIEYNGVKLHLKDWETITKHVTTYNKSDILISHFRSNLGIIKEELNVELLSTNYDKVIAGDIHHRHKPFPNIMYCSSPYSTKYVNPSELEEFGYIELYINETNSECRYVTLDLPSKLKVKCGRKDLEETIKRYSKHLLRVIITGTLEELHELPMYDNVQYVKNIIENTYTESTSSTQAVSIIDSIVSTLPESVDKSKAIAILLDLEKDIK